MGRAMDLTGQKYGRMTVISLSERQPNKSTKWLCRCECGNERIVHHSALRGGGTKSCGCFRSDYMREKIRRKSTLTGKVFGRLTVMSRGKLIDGEWSSVCRCTCGITTTVRNKSLTRGETQSCGCLWYEAVCRQRTSRTELQGQRFGRLVVMEKLKAGEKKPWTCFRCVCDCGNETFPTKYAMVSGTHVSCGCYNSECEDIVGRKFNRWLVIAKESARGRHGEILWRCLCECGKERIKSANSLRQPRNASCGCLSRIAIDTTKFSGELTPEEAYWLGMLYTDGNLHKNRIWLGLRTGDKSHVQKFANFLGAVVEPYATENYATGMACFAVSNPILSANLVRLGLHPHKSWTIQPWAGPKHLMRDFWRGCIDGDGWVSLSRHSPVIGYCGNEHMATGLRDYVTELTGSRANLLRRPGQGKYAVAHGLQFCHIAWGGNNICRALASHFYQEGDVALERKRVIAEVIKSSPRVLRSSIAKLNRLNGD